MAIGFSSSLCEEWGLEMWEASTKCQETAKVDIYQHSEDGAIKLTLPPPDWLFKENRGNIVPLA